MRRGGDTKFIDLFSKIRVGNVDEDAQKQIRERFIEESTQLLRKCSAYVC